MPPWRLKMRMFQSQGRFFGGCCGPRRADGVPVLVVSIAGAILWGVLPSKVAILTKHCPVSIAGAILWGVLQ